MGGGLELFLHYELVNKVSQKKLFYKQRRTDIFVRFWLSCLCPIFEIVSWSYAMIETLGALFILHKLKFSFQHPVVGKIKIEKSNFDGLAWNANP